MANVFPGKITFFFPCAGVETMESWSMETQISFKKCLRTKCLSMCLEMAGQQVIFGREFPSLFQRRHQETRLHIEFQVIEFHPCIDFFYNFPGAGCIGGTTP